MNLVSLVLNWWMMAIRGVLAMAFGVSILVWPNVTLSIVVMLFGLYALLDGVWTIAAGTRASTRVFDAWPVLLEGVVAAAPELERVIAPHLDREFSRLSPVERGILLLAGYELSHQPEVPYRAVINEAVELAKEYGGTDGHKFVNGVLDKLAARLRAAEQASGKR